MRTVLFAAAAAVLAVAAPAASHAQVVIQAPPGLVPAPPPGPYWRGSEGDWRRREEVREHYREEAWRRDHCVRDFRGEVFCRR